MLSTTAEYQATDLVRNAPLPQGLDRLVYSSAGLFKRLSDSSKAFGLRADDILQQREEFKTWKSGRLKQEIRSLREAVRRERHDPTEAAIAALPALVEASSRVLRLTPYREQIMGVLALQGNHITEMATGEGKTLTIALAGITAGWTGFPCHIITANDYLAERDATNMRLLYTFCGLTVESVLRNMDPPARQKAYRADVVYTTSKEVVADFLRDRLRLRRLHPSAFRSNRKLVDHRMNTLELLVQRGMHTAIVDEADNLLIDEAVTPLIISRPQENQSLAKAIRVADEVARELVEGQDFVRDDQLRTVELYASAKERMHQHKDRLGRFYRESTWLEELLQKALIARCYFERDRQYVVQDKEIIIVDDFTGRLMQGRSWKQGLQQAIEAKEDLPITDPSESVTSLSFQRFFRFYRRLSGITGTARESAHEFWEVYNLSFIRIPRHRPLQRVDNPSRVYPDTGSKWEALLDEIESVHETGRPILVGTRSIHDSERISEQLSHRGVAHRLLNASREREEAQIIALAGHRDGVTIATNMAGRGTDIKLHDDVIKLGGLHVIATELNESLRIDRQLYGRAGRQGDPGTSSTLVSLEDGVLIQHGKFIKQIMDALFRLPPFPARDRLARLALRLAQRKAERTARTQRGGVTRRDSWIEEVFAMSGMELGS